MTPLAVVEGVKSAMDTAKSTNLYRYTNGELATLLIHQVHTDDGRWVEVPSWLADEIVKRLKGEE